jgi:hypothetical protein
LQRKIPSFHFSTENTPSGRDTHTFILETRENKTDLLPVRQFQHISILYITTIEAKMWQGVDGNSAAGEAFIRCAMNGRLGNFPIRLYAMIESAEDLGFSSIVSWQPHGKSRSFVDMVE